LITDRAIENCHAAIAASVSVQILQASVAVEKCCGHDLDAGARILRKEGGVFRTLIIPRIFNACFVF
jgi:hypothetical protein